MVTTSWSVRFLAMLALGWGLLGGSGEAQAAQCDVYGGTTYVGCVLPTIKWNDGHGNLFDSKVDAAQSNYGYFLAANPTTSLTSGVKLAPVAYLREQSGSCALVAETDNDYLRTDTVGGSDWNWYDWVPIHGYTTQTRATCFTYQKHQTAIYGTGTNISPIGICPPDYTRINEYGLASRTAPFGWACRPTPDLSDLKRALPCATCDADVPNQAVTDHPVLLGTQQKRDQAVDLTTGGPFPIVWSRTYASQNLQGWKFGPERTALYRETASLHVVSFRRGDGSWLFFQAPVPSSGSNHVWTSTMSTGWKAAIRSVPTDVRNGSGAMVGVRLTQADGTQETYGLDGRLQTVENAQGYRHTYTYGSYGELLRIDDDFGHRITLTYATNNGLLPFSVSWPGGDPYAGTGGGSTGFSGWSSLAGFLAGTARPTSVSDGVRTVNYTWTPISNGALDKTFVLSQVQHADGTTVGYLYGESGLSTNASYLTGVVDETGQRLASYAYSTSSDAMVTEEWRHTGVLGAKTERFLFGGTVTDPLGNTFQIGTNGAAQVLNQNKPCRWCNNDLQAKQVTYTANLPTTIKDFNNVDETRTYDANGLLLTRTEASGTALARTTTWTWDTAMRLPLTQVEPIKVGGVAKTRTTTWTYNASRQPLTEVVSTNTGEPSRTTTFTYNGLGLLETTTNPRGTVTRRTYTAAGDLASIVEADGTALARTTTFGGHTSSGLPSWATDANGLTTRVVWDARDRPVTVERGVAGVGGPGGSGGTWETTTMTYTPFGAIASLTRPDGVKLEWSYNVAQRVVQIRQKSAGGTGLGQVDFTLNAAGDATTETLSKGGVVVRTRSSTYDTTSRPNVSLGALGQATTTTFEPNGQPATVKDPLNHTIAQAYDALKRATVQTDALLGTGTLAYDVDDNVVSATDARGVVTTTAYNAFKEAVTTTSPDRGAWTTAFDANGNPVTVTDPRGVVATASYDALDRPTSLFWNGTAAVGSAGFDPVARSVTYTWDACTNGIGKLCSVSDHAGTTAYAYDAWGRRTGQAFQPAGEAFTLTTGTAYDATGRTSAVTYPSGKALTFTYGADGRVASQAWAGSNVLDTIAWQPMGGPVTGWTWSSAGIPVGKAQVTMGYDQDGRATGQSDVDTLTRTYDLADRQTSVAYTGASGKDQIYTYDAKDRLTQSDNASFPAAMTYGYDAGTNRTSKAIATDGYTHTYASTSNRLATTTTVVAGVPGTPVARTYDAMGNGRNDGVGGSFAYDAMGRMSQATASGSATTFVVGANGLRTRKTTTGSHAGDAIYVHDGQRRLLGVYVPDGLGGFTVQEETLYLDDSWRIVGTVRGQVLGGADGTVYPVLSDPMGTPRAVLDPSSGDARWEWEGREAFGHQLPNEDPTGLAGAFTFNARFPGQWLDVETGLYHNGYRDYDPRTGRYVESDPIGLGGGWNTYAYVSGDPLGGMDPWGLSKEDVVRFQQQFEKTVSRMTAEGVRNPDTTLNNRYGKWEDTWMKFPGGNFIARWYKIGKDGNGYEVCSGQTRILSSDLFKILTEKTDDVWQMSNPYNGSHYWIELKSSNPSDPTIWMDPWDNKFSVGTPCPRCKMERFSHEEDSL